MRPGSAVSPAGAGLARARYPDLPSAAAHYESFYLKAAQPGGGLAVWIRYTVFKAPGEAAVGALWLTLFDAGAPRPLAVKVRATPVPPGPGAHIRLGDARLGATEIVGAAGGEAAWELAYESRDEPFPYLPRGWMYGARLPKTKAVALHPAARFSGTISLPGRRITLEGWPGMIGHNWGSEHPHRGIWIHGADFAEDPAAYLDIVIGQIRLGPLTTPWIGNGCLALDGSRHRLGGPAPGSTKVTASPSGARFRMRGPGVEVEGEVSAPPQRIVAWRYSNPAGGWHPTSHSSIGELTVRVRAGERVRRLTCCAGASYELQAPERDLPVGLEAAPDP